MKRMKLVEMLVIAAVVSVMSLNASGSTYKVIYNFTGGQDGANPVDAGNLAIDGNGNLYGTTNLGGACGQGTLFELSPNGSGGWTETVVHSFCGQGAQDGAYPAAAPFYTPNVLTGSTTYGGSFNEGTLYFNNVGGIYFGYSLQCETGIYSGGCFPYTTLVDQLIPSFSGLFATFYGGGTYNRGLLLYDGGATAYSFCLFSSCPDGSGPGSALALDSNLNAYGTTRLGGVSGQGVVYECVAQPDGSCNPVTVLHSFAGGPTDGARPFLATPLLTQSCTQFGCGNIVWGTTPLGGAYGDTIGGYGTVWDIDNFGVFHLVHSFDWTDGAFPYAGLTSLNGTYYGTTSGGGPFQRQCCPLRFSVGQGTIYSLTSSGTLTTLHTFTGSDGALPYSGLVADSSGNLYGVTNLGGAYGFGVVYEITP